MPLQAGEYSTFSVHPCNVTRAYVEKVGTSKKGYHYQPGFDATVAIGSNAETIAISCNGRSYDLKTTADKVLREGCCDVGGTSTCWFDAQKAASFRQTNMWSLKPTCVYYGDFATDPTQDLILGGVMLALIVLCFVWIKVWSVFSSWMKKHDPQSRISGRWGGSAFAAGKHCEEYEIWRKENPTTNESAGSGSSQARVQNPTSSTDLHTHSSNAGTI
jgi:hypothetical protein